MNIDINEQLLRLAIELGRHHTKKEAVHQALEHYVRRLQQLKMLELQGQVIWEGDLDEMRGV